MRNRKFFVALAAAAMLSTSGCTALGALSTIGGLVTGGAPVGACSSLNFERAYYTFEAGYNGVSQALNAVAGTAVMPTGSPRALQAKGYYQHLIQVRTAVIHAHETCDAPSLAAQITSGNAVIGDLQLLVAGKA